MTPPKSKKASSKSARLKKSNLSFPFGVIDLGTNSIRMDIHRLHEGKATLLHREKRMVRLGEGLFPGRVLQSAPIERTLDALKDFRVALDLHQVKNIYAFATSAVREANNRRTFLDRVYKDTGIRIRVLSGKKEALWIAFAILKREKTTGSEVLIDIGGGSTELSVCRKDKVLQSESLPLGVARISQVYLSACPPEQESLRALRAAIQKQLRRRFDRKRASFLIGSSGTTKGVAQILRMNQLATPFSLEELASLNQRMSTLDRNGLLRLEGMEPKRVDLILGGCILLEECARYFGAKNLRYTEVALKDGILDQVVESRGSRL